MCNKKVPSDGAAGCSSCRKFYHLECINLLPADLEYMRDHNMYWNCSLCVASGRRLRSGSVSNTPVNVNLPQNSSFQDNFERLFAELNSIKVMQQSVIDDISALKQSQAQLSSDLAVKYAKLQGEVESCNLKLDDHERLLGTHSDILHNLTSRVSQFEHRMESVGSGCSPASPALRLNCSEDEVLAEIADRQKRTKNIMLFRVKENQGASGVERKAADLNYVKQLFAFLESDSTVVGVSRMGRFDATRNRPVRVTLQSEVEVHGIIRNAKKLRNAADYRDVSISFDRTPKQLAQHRALRSELREREAKGERNLKIRFVSGMPKIVSLN